MRQQFAWWNQITNLAFKHGQRDHVTTQQVIILASSSETCCSSAAFCVTVWRVDTSCACTGLTGRLGAPTSWPALVLWRRRTPKTKVDRSDLAPGKACRKILEVSWVVILKVVNCSWTMDWISANLMHAWYGPSFGFSLLMNDVDKFYITIQKFVYIT